MDDIDLDNIFNQLKESNVIDTQTTESEIDKKYQCDYCDGTIVLEDGCS